MAAQALDGVRTDIQAVDFVAVVTQQALGQVVADEAVDAQDQHAGAARSTTGFGAAQHGTVHQAQLVGQLRAAQVQTVVVALACVDDQRVLTAGDAQRVDADDAARRQAFVALGDFGACLLYTSDAADE